MSDYSTTRLQDHTTDDANMCRSQWSVVPPTRSYGAAGSSQSSSRESAFTLAELAVSVGVLVLLVFLATQLLNSAATVTTLGHKQMDADSQARQLLDRMAVDFAQMVKRSDIDYYLKSSQTGTPDCTTCTPQTAVDGTRNDPTGNDQIAFFGATSGYYPTPGFQSPISLISYRVNSGSSSSSYDKLERMGKGFVWNAVSSSYKPILFLDGATPPTTRIKTQWPVAVSSNATDSDCNNTGCYETIGPQVFRFEYYYLLKGQTAQVGAPTPTPAPTPPTFSDTPWDTRISGHTNVSGMRDVAAIIVGIAVIDPKSKVLLTDAQLATLAGTLIDYGASAAAGCPSPNWQAPGELRRQWQCALDNTSGLPRPAISGIRMYERYFYLNQ